MEGRRVTALLPHVSAQPSPHRAGAFPRTRRSELDFTWVFLVRNFPDGFEGDMSRKEQLPSRVGIDRTLLSQETTFSAEGMRCGVRLPQGFRDIVHRYH